MNYRLALRFGTGTEKAVDFSTANLVGFLREIHTARSHHCGKSKIFDNIDNGFGFDNGQVFKPENTQIRKLPSRQRKKRRKGATPKVKSRDIQ